MTAYDECYLDSMLQKHRYLYKLIARNCKEVFSTITIYMKSLCREKMDQGNPKFLNKTPKQILGDLNIAVDESAGISEAYDEFILEWIADIYTYLQWKYALPSEQIVSRILPEELYKMYYPLHEASLENAVDKLKKRYDLQ